KPQRQTTQVEKSVRAVLDRLAGQHVAGVVLLTDGRDAPAQPVTETLAALKDYGVKVYPIPLGSDKPPQNIVVESVTVQDSAFKGDIVNVKAVVRGVGYEANHPITLTLTDRKTGKTLVAPTGGSGVETKINLPDDRP